ncbi:MAG: lytic transglycosylase domain-containing protein [Verrucomicrobia bacterium]|nr:lytic transglycosylase domain-containing protein [Verrucomicrobiota bacterium]
MKLRRLWKFRWTLLLGLVALWAVHWYHEGRQRIHDAAIIASARRYGVDPALVKAVVWRESKFDPHARGRAGEIGLMQIMPSVASEWAEAERVTLYSLYDPETNIRCGAWQLARLLKRYRNTDNPVPYALAAYNAGPGNAQKWMQGAAVTSGAVFIEQIGFPSTKNYVKAVMERYASYRPVFPPQQQQ